MHKGSFALLLLIALAKLKAQTPAVVWNEKLFIQLSKNQAARLSSNEMQLSSLEAQKKAYDKITQQLTQIVAIEEYLHMQISSVHSLLRQGKSLEQYEYYAKEISVRSAELLTVSAKHPQYAILLGRYYEHVLIESLKLKDELKEILREDPKFLLSTYDRQLLIEKVLYRARSVHGYLLYIILRLKSMHQLPYLEQIPVLDKYIGLDRMIVKDLMQRYQTLLN